MKRMPMTVNEIFAENLAASGYAKKEELFPILNKLTEEEIHILSSATERTCEKLGTEAFSCEFLYGEDDRYENIVAKPERDLPHLTKNNKK